MASISCSSLSRPTLESCDSISDSMDFYGITRSVSPRNSSCFICFFVLLLLQTCKDQYFNYNVSDFSYGGLMQSFLKSSFHCRADQQYAAGGQYTGTENMRRIPGEMEQLTQYRHA